MKDVWVVDRIEGAIVVLEQPDETMVCLPLSDLPEGLKAGNLLKKDTSGGFYIDTKAEAGRREEIADLYRDVFGRQGENGEK